MGNGMKSLPDRSEVGPREGGDPEGGRAKIQPRICMPSWRNFRKAAYYGGVYEAQDVIREIDDVDVVLLNPGRGYHIREKWLRKLLWKGPTKHLAFLNPGLQAVRLERHYDLFLAVCQNWWDLLSLNAIKGWNERCRISVCWMEELWSAWIPSFKNWLHLLNRFDHVFLNLRGSVPVVEEALGRRCRWLPQGIDAIRFSPYPDPPARVIDVYSIGRKWEGVHRAFGEQAARTGMFYIYDTGNISDLVIPDPAQHRSLLANLAKRSRFFLVAPAKMDSPFDTSGQIEVGSRYFEGAAAGAVLIGEKAHCAAFGQLFNWADAVIEIKIDGSDLPDILSGLAKQPDRLREISRRNSEQMLKRHDWAYRWKEILNLAGLKPRPALQAREARLARLADQAQRME